MMQRLLHVTTEYIKFTFAMMLAGTATFALAGLAISRPSIFAVVMGAIVIIGVAVFIEVRDHNRLRVRARKSKSNPKAASETLADILDFSKGLATAYAPILYFAAHAEPPEAQPAPVRSLLISQWNVDPRSVASWRHTFKGSETEIVMQYLATRREELDRIGVYPYFVSKAPSQEVIRMMRESGTIHKWGDIAVSQIVAAHHGSKEKTISIGFLSANAQSVPKSLLTLFAEQFDLVSVDVLEARGR